MQSFFKVLKRIGEKDKNSLFKNVEKLCETKKQKSIDGITSQLLFPEYFESYSLRIKDKSRWQKLNKNTFEFWHFYPSLLRLSEVKKVSNGCSGINFHHTGPHQTGSSKHHVLHSNTLQDIFRSSSKQGDKIAWWLNVWIAPWPPV